MEFCQYLEIMGKEAADALPEHWPYDSKIDLQEGSTAPWGPFYPLSEEELRTLSVTLGYRAVKVITRRELSGGDQRRGERNAEGLYSGPNCLEANLGLRESRREIRNGIKSYGRKGTDLGP